MNEQQKLTFSSRFPGLDEGQISRLVEVVDSMGYTDPIQKLEKQRQLYQQVLPVIKEKQHKIGRVEVQNQLFHNRENAKSTDDFVKNDVLLKTSEFADLFRRAYGLPSKISDDKIMEALKNGDPDFKNKFARYLSGDTNVLAEMGIKEEEMIQWGEGSKFGLLRPQEDKERNDNLFGRLKATDEATTAGGVLKEFGMNTLKSTVNLASDLGNMVANPWDTAKGLTKGVLGGIANAVGADERLAERSDFWAGANETADAMGSAIAERYGSFDKFSKTAYTDPVGVFSDIMSVITLGAGATRIGAKLGMKGSQAAQLTKTAGKLAKVADVAGDIAKVADAVDPANIMMKRAGKVVGYGLGKTKKGIKALDLGEKTKSIISGLDKDTRKGIQNNPYVSEYWKEAKNIIEQDGVPQDIKELSRPQYEKVGSDLLNTISRAKEAFSESGPLYQKIREINAKVDITPALEEIKNVLEKHDIKITENGALDFGYSSIVKNEDMHAISTLLERVNDGLINDANTVLNLRKVSDQLSKWDSGTTSEGMKVIRDIRKEIDNVAKEQIPGLEELDKLYRSRIDDLNQIQEGIVYRQGDRRGQVRDNFNQIIKTIGGENRARMAERLGEIAPDLLERVSAIHGVEKLAKAYTNTPKLSKLAGPLTGAVGLGYLTNSWTGAVVGALVSYFGDSIFSKISKAHLNKIASKMSPEALTKLEEINEKIAKRTLLSETDKALLNKIKAEIVNGKNDGLLALEYKDYNGVIGDQTKIITDPNGNSWREGQIAEINNQKNLPKEEGLGKLREGAETTFQKIEGNEKYGIADNTEKTLSAQQAKQIKNIRNGRSVEEIANDYGVAIEVADKITTPEGIRAYGKYGDGVITLAEKIKEGTAPHELFHATFDMVDHARKESILRQIEKSKGLDSLNAEEYLADSFSEYFRTGKFDTKSFGKGLVGKMQQFFYEVKQFITRASKNKAHIKKLFDEILDGEVDREMLGEILGNKKKVATDSRAQGAPSLQPPLSRYSIQITDKNSSFYKQKFDALKTKLKTDGLSAREFIDEIKLITKDKGNSGYMIKSKNGEKASIRISDHYANAQNNKNRGEFGNNASIVIKIPSKKKSFFKADNEVNLIEYVYKPENLTLKKMENILDSFKEWIDTTEYNDKGYDLKHISTKASLENGEVRYQRVYHGSPYEFEKFDSAHMGKGAGSQAHGWGHYVSIDKEIGKAYADPTQTPGEALRFKGKKGSLYEVEVPDPVKTDTPTKSNYLYESRKLDRDELMQFYGYLKTNKRGNIDVFKEWVDTGHIGDGEDLYGALSYVLGGDKAASLFLKEMGYDGVSYYDVGDGQAYVIFDDAKLEIKKHSKL